MTFVQVSLGSQINSNDRKDRKDYLLLEYLSGFEEPVKISESSVPHEIRVNFQFHGTDIKQVPDSIYGRLHELTKYNLVKAPYAKQWEITEAGRTELRKYKAAQSKRSFEEYCDAVLKLIVEEDSKRRTLNAFEISQQLNIDYDVINDVAEEFDQRKFVKLATTDGHWVFLFFPRQSCFIERLHLLKKNNKRAAHLLTVHELHRQDLFLLRKKKKL